MKVGVLALQGGAKEHLIMLRRCGVEPVEVKKAEDMDNIYGLIIPGGESTTIGKLMKDNGLDKEIIRKSELGMPIYGSCAGAILLSKYISGKRQPKLGLVDITIKRNDYGRQIDSFEAMLEIDEFKKPFRGIFIRAPVIESIHNGVKIMSKFNGRPVLARQENLLLSTFHPELTDDSRIHEFFVDMIRKSPGY